MFLDIGSGLGKPSFHVALEAPKIRAAMGLELLEHPWKLSRVNLRNVVASGVNL